MDKFDSSLTNGFSNLVSDVTDLKSIYATLISQNKVTHRQLTALEKDILIIIKNTTKDYRKRNNELP